MHRPGIEPESREWESRMIPLHQRRLHVKSKFNLKIGSSNLLIKITEAIHSTVCSIHRLLLYSK